MNRKLLLIPAVIAGSLGLATLADAHFPVVTPSCAGITLNFTQYEGDASNNRITMQVDGATPWYITFGDHYSGNFAWPPTANHTWSVFIDANRNTGNPTQYDQTFSGTQIACQAAPTTTVAPTTTIPATTAPTTTVAASTTTAPATTTSNSISVPTTVLVTVPCPAEGPCFGCPVLANPVCGPTLDTLDPTTTAARLAVTDLQLPRTGPSGFELTNAAIGLGVLVLGLILARVARRPA